MDTSLLLPSRQDTPGEFAGGLPSAPFLEPVGEALKAILAGRMLHPRFQPILELRGGALYGFEGLIRGPSDTVLHSPLNLLRVASHLGVLYEMESSCVATLLDAYARSRQSLKLFLNVSPHALVKSFQQPLFQASVLATLGLTPGQIVIELTESEPTFDWAPLVRAAEHFRALGFSIALDDLGEGFASLKLWSELRPDYVKIDKHFVQGVSFDPVKHQFLRTIHDLAARTGARTVAEGIENEADLAIVQALGLDFGQGHFLGRPAPAPVPVAPPTILLERGREENQKTPVWTGQARTTTTKLLRVVVPVAPDTTNLEVQHRFIGEPALQSLPVVQDDRPIGILNRYEFMENMARPYRRELFGKRPCSIFMEKEILVVDHRTTLHELSQLIVESDLRYSMQGFVITRGGRYAGMGSGHALMREITEFQISTARYANPLTLLPGNVPIQEHLETLLERNLAFVVAYADLDHFKPYNDVYGYRKGDEVIQWTAKLLQNVCDPAMDFLGHVGGDDFILVMRGPRWYEQLEEALASFREGRMSFFAEEERRRGGYESEDRTGQIVFHPLLTISIGALRVAPGQYPSHHDVSAAASLAKKMAKRLEGCSLFLERRAN